jgi:hypothetical protein
MYIPWILISEVSLTNIPGFCHGVHEEHWKVWKLMGCCVQLQYGSVVPLDNK